MNGELLFLPHYSFITCMQKYLTAVNSKRYSDSC